MPDGLISILAALGVVLAAALGGALLQRGQVRWVWVIAASAAILAHDALLTGAWSWLPWPALGEDWNWSGKIAALLGTLVIAALPVIGFRRAGLTLVQDRTGLRSSLAVSALLVVLFLALALVFPGEGGDAEAFAFQLTMPGLEEEVFYRGVLLLMLNEAFGRPVWVLGAPIGWAAILASLAFGLDHALGYGEAGFSFDPLALALTGGPALILVWLRERTGSLLLPVLLHNYANVIPMVI